MTRWGSRLGNENEIHAELRQNELESDQRVREKEEMAPTSNLAAREAVNRAQRGSWDSCSDGGTGAPSAGRKSRAVSTRQHHPEAFPEPAGAEPTLPLRHLVTNTLVPHSNSDRSVQTRGCPSQLLHPLTRTAPYLDGFSDNEESRSTEGTREYHLWEKNQGRSFGEY